MKLFFLRATKIRYNILGSNEALAGGRKTMAEETVIRDVQRLVSQYGGTASDWAKISTGAAQPNSVQNFARQAGANIEVHYYMNKATGMIVELKSSIHK